MLSCLSLFDMIAGLYIWIPEVCRENQRSEKLFGNFSLDFFKIEKYDRFNKSYKSYFSNLGGGENETGYAKG